MRILIAPDKFKTTLSSRQVARSLAIGLCKTLPHSEIKTLVVSDGGEGFLEALAQSEPLNFLPLKIRGPLGETRHASLGISSNGKRVFIESSQATGLHLVPPGKRNPLLTSSAGVADLLREAFRTGAAEIFIGIGSSATCDIGLPVAESLGFRFLDRNGKKVDCRPANFMKIKKIIFPDLSAQIKHPVKIRIIADVLNPPIGPHGGVRYYSPQKGARRGEVAFLEKATLHIISLLGKKSPTALKRLKGGGAAGGLGLGLHVFLGAEILEGSEFFMKRLDLRKLIKRSDAVITGEGSFDRQSFFGKIPGKIIRYAYENGKKIFLVTGRKKIPSAIRPKIDGAFSVEELLEDGEIRDLRESARALEIIGKNIACRVGANRSTA